MAFKILKQKGLVSKALIIAPLRPVYKVWPDEVKKWADFADLTYSVLHGGSKEAALAKDVDLYIINPEGLKWLFDPKKKRPQWDVLIVDESTKFKDSTTQRFKALKAFLPSFTRRWILTGTPVPNGLMDLFGQIYVLDLGRSLGRFITHYRNQYFTPSGYGGYDWKIRPGAYEEIVEMISPLILQLSAEEYLEMPELVYRQIEVTLPKTVKAIYDELEKEFIVSISTQTELVALNAAAAGTKLRQIANGAVYTKSPAWEGLHEEKLDALQSLLEELNGHSVLILYEFDHDRQRIINRLGDIPTLSGVSANGLDRLIDGFNDGSIPILIGHPASMGHGLNLQGACHTIIWFGITWNLEYYDQAIARVYRQGQQSGHVYVYHIVAKETKDEEVMQVLTKKDRGQQDLLSALKEARETL
jgi:SNF2 family DNA or RNA helicase